MKKISSSDKKRKNVFSTQPLSLNPNNQKTIKQLKKLTKSDVLDVLQNEFAFDDEEVESIALKGVHLYNAICDYRTNIESGKTPQIARKAIIDSLLKDSNNNNLVSKTLANWLIEGYIRKNENISMYNNVSGVIAVDEMVMFITKYIDLKVNLQTMDEKIQRSSRILVNSFGRDFEFIGRDESVGAIMNVYRKQDLKDDGGTIDKIDVQLPFIAAAPGVGKSRLLKEMGLLLSKTDDLNVKYFPLFVTFGNGCSFDQMVESFRPIESLLLRMIYSMIIGCNDLAFDEFRNSFSSLVKNRTLNMITVLDALRQVFFENNNKIGFYIAIDEAHLVDTDTNEKQSNPLLQIMSSIGQFIQSMSEYKTNILPLFAGTYHNVISQNLARSTYSPYYIPMTALLPEDKIRYILDKAQLSNEKLTNWRTNMEFRHFLRLFGGFPRGIEFYLECFQNRNERGAWESAYSALTNKYPVFNSLYSKTLLYYIMTRKIISKTDVVITNQTRQVTFSDLENKGHIMLDQVEQDKFIALYPPVLLRNLIPTEFTKLYEDLFFNFDKSINGGRHWEDIIQRYLCFKLSLLSDNEEDLTIEHLFPFAQMQPNTASIKLQRIPKVEMMNAVNKIQYKQKKIKLTTSSGYSRFDFDVRAYNNLEFKQKDCFVVLNDTTDDAEVGQDVLILGLEEKHGTAILVFHVQCKWVDSESGNLSLSEVNKELEKNRKLQFTNEKDEDLQVHNITVIITGKTVSVIPEENDLIVIHKQNFANYFGVFANQMKFLHAKQFLHINECNYNELQSFKGIDDEKATTIMEKRGKSGFKDSNDLKKKTSASMFELLSNFDIIY